MSPCTYKGIRREKENRRQIQTLDTSSTVAPRIWRVFLLQFSSSFQKYRKTPADSLVISRQQIRRQCSEVSTQIYLTSIRSFVCLSISHEETISLPKGFTEILKNPRQQSTQANKMAPHVIKEAVEFYYSIK